MFWETEFFCISRNGTFQTYILGSNISGSKNEKKKPVSDHHLAQNLKHFLHFRKELTGPENEKMTADLVCIPNASNNEFLGF